jgi:hypothetical protein
MYDLYRYQYFLSVVPTIVVENQFWGGNDVILTNQYAVTEQHHPSAGQMGPEIPGINSTVFKFTCRDIFQV